MIARVPLIVDPDTIFLSSFSNHPSAKEFPPLLASKGADAQRILTDRTKGILGTFVNPSITGPGGISIIRCAHQNRPGIPVYILEDPGQPLFEQDEMRLLGVQKKIWKPI